MRTHLCKFEYLYSILMKAFKKCIQKFFKGNCKLQKDNVKGIDFLFHFFLIMCTMLIISMLHFILWQTVGIMPKLAKVKRESWLKRTWTNENQKKQVKKQWNKLLTG